MVNNAKPTDEMNKMTVTMNINLQIVQLLFGAKTSESFLSSRISLGLFILAIIYAFL